MLLNTDKRHFDDIVIRDFNPDGTCTSTETYPITMGGFTKTFNGQRGIPYNKGEVNLNDVYISTTTFDCEPTTFATPVHPAWGQREWKGPLAASLWYTNGFDKQLPYSITGENFTGDVSLQTAFAGVGKADVGGQLILAELGETVNLLRNPLQGISKLAKDPRNAKVLQKKLNSFGDITAGQYLKIMFGVLPLINDIEDVVSTVKGILNDQPLMRSGGTSEYEEENSSVRPYNLRGMTGTFTVHTELKVKASSHVYYKYKWDTKMYRIMNQWGLNPLDIPYTMWQVLPASFVADWFYSIGPWLDTLIPRPDIEILGNHSSWKTTRKNSLYINEQPSIYIGTAPSQTYMLPFFGGYVETQTYLNRIVNRPEPLTPLYTHKGINSLGKAISSAAMAWQKLPKNLKRS